MSSCAQDVSPRLRGRLSTVVYGGAKNHYTTKSHSKQTKRSCQLHVNKNLLGIAWVLHHNELCVRK